MFDKYKNQNEIRELIEGFPTEKEAESFTDKILASSTQADGFWQGLHFYGKPGLRGWAGATTESIPDLTKRGGHGLGGLGNWNDEIQSIYVYDGTWILYENINYQEPSRQFEKGRYDNIGALANRVSSIKRIA